MALGIGVPAYKVVTPEADRNRLRDWSQLAKSLGLLAEYMADLQRMNHRLTYSPSKFGDPLKTFSHAKLRLHRALTEFLVVEYGIHRSRRIVFIRNISRRPDRPLGSIP